MPPKKEGGRESLRSPAPRVASGDEPETSQASAEPRRRGGVAGVGHVPVREVAPPVASSPGEGGKSFPASARAGPRVGAAVKASGLRSFSLGARWLAKDGPCRGGPRPRVFV